LALRKQDSVSLIVKRRFDIRYSRISIKFVKRFFRELTVLFPDFTDPGARMLKIRAKCYGHALLGIGCGCLRGVSDLTANEKAKRRKAF